MLLAAINPAVLLGFATRLDPLTPLVSLWVLPPQYWVISGAL
jgi:hypothetical protein